MEITKLFTQSPKLYRNKNQLKSIRNTKLPRQLMPFVYTLANFVQNSLLLFYRWSGWQETFLQTKYYSILLQNYSVNQLLQ